MPHLDRSLITAKVAKHYSRQATKIWQFNPRNRPAAVLLPLCVVDNKLSVLFTLRSSNLSSHKGEVSFPGGRRDPGETPLQTALRETEEEIHVPSTNIEVIGPFMTTASLIGDEVVCIIGDLGEIDLSAMSWSKDEVECIFVMSLEQLRETTTTEDYRDTGIKIPSWAVDPSKVKGINNVKIVGLTGYV